MLFPIFGGRLKYQNITGLINDVPRSGEIYYIYVDMSGANIRMNCEDLQMYSYNIWISLAQMF